MIITLHMYLTKKMFHILQPQFFVVIHASLLMYPSIIYIFNIETHTTHK